MTKYRCPKHGELFDGQYLCPICQQEEQYRHTERLREEERRRVREREEEQRIARQRQEEQRRINQQQAQKNTQGKTNSSDSDGWETVSGVVGFITFLVVAIYSYQTSESEDAWIVAGILGLIAGVLAYKLFKYIVYLAVFLFILYLIIEFLGK